MNQTNNETLTAVNFLDKLRSDTLDLHARLESLPISKAIISAGITPKIYGDYLALMHDVVRDMETNVFPILAEVIPDLGERHKVIGIKRDLVSLGRKIDSNLTELIGDFTIPFALGIMYVVEGSSLGGRFILKNVEKALGYSPEKGTTYFSGYGEQTGSMWKKFLNTLTEFEIQNRCGNEIIAGANYAFNVIYNHLSGIQK